MTDLLIALPESDVQTCDEEELDHFVCMCVNPKISFCGVYLDELTTGFVDDVSCKACNKGKCLFCGQCYNGNPCSICENEWIENEA